MAEADKLCGEDLAVVIPKNTFPVGTTPLTITAASSLNTMQTILQMTQL
jgi:hypothetical protein